jgi:hypothetical protein
LAYSLILIKCLQTSIRLQSIRSLKIVLFTSLNIVFINIYFACFWQGNPEKYQGDHPVACQETSSS